MEKVERRKADQGIVDGCFFTWVEVTQRYSEKLMEEKKFNDYRKINSD